MVGRNGVGKSTFLRAVACRHVEVPSFMHVIHVEQECVGDDRTALQTVLEADLEREWLMSMEKRLCDDEIGEEEAGVSLGEVYERLEELDSDSAESNAAVILSGCLVLFFSPYIFCRSDLHVIWT